MNTTDRKQENSTITKWVLFLSFCICVFIGSWWLVSFKSDYGGSNMLQTRIRPLAVGDQISSQDFDAEITEGLLQQPQNYVWNPSAQKSLPIGSEQSLSGKNSFKFFEEVNKSPLILFHFWASWCAPCIKEIPEMMAWADHQPTALILAISVDETEAAFSDFMKTLRNLRKEKWPENIRWIWDSKKSSARYFGVDRLPETFFLDPDRRVKIHKAGSFNWDLKNP